MKTPDAAAGAVEQQRGVADTAFLHVQNGSDWLPRLAFVQAAAHHERNAVWKIVAAVMPCVRNGDESAVFCFDQRGNSIGMNAVIPGMKEIDL